MRDVQTAHVYFKNSPFGSGHRYLNVESLGPKWVKLREAASLVRLRMKRSEFEASLVKWLPDDLAAKFHAKMQANIEALALRRTTQKTEDVTDYVEAEIVEKDPVEDTEAFEHDRFIFALPEEG